MEIMLDIETLDTLPSAVILSIAAIPFHKEENHIASQELFLSVDQRCQKNRSKSASTIQFWLDQPPPVYEKNFKGEYSLEYSLMRLTAFCEKTNPREFWSKGKFDFEILEHAYRQIGLKPAWDFWRVRDVRTILGETGIRMKKNNHDPVEDCLNQIQAVLEAHEKINRGTRW